MTNAVIVGQGYVGLPLAVAAARAGVLVRGLELNKQIVESLNAGISHIDDISDPDVASAIRYGYVATTDPKVITAADVVIVCVPTPLGEDGQPDLGPVMSAARTIGEHLSSDTTVVLESTTHPGTTEELFAPLVLGDTYALDADVYIAFSPERVDPGNSVYGIRNTPKIVGGLTAESTTRAKAFYELFVDEVISAKGAKEAEMAKLLENTYRHVNIALMNEMLRLSNDLGIDLWNAIDCAATKPFGFQPFRPGPGVGGHCIPVDPNYLSHQVKARLGYAFRMVELAQEINQAAPRYVVQRAWHVLNAKNRPMNGSRVLVVGVTYKPDIADTRESPASSIIQQFDELGARVSYFDPFVATFDVNAMGPVKRDVSLDHLDERYDLVVLLQPHRSIDLQKITASAVTVLDTRAALQESDTVVRL